MNSESYAATTSGDIYDIILFWGQSNMVGWCKETEETRYTASDSNSINRFSSDTGIDKSILKNTSQYKNFIKINQKNDTVFEYVYGSNSFVKIDSNTKITGEYLSFQSTNSSGQPQNLRVATNNIATEPSKGTNMIPQFCKTYYENTGHKVIAVHCALRSDSYVSVSSI